MDPDISRHKYEKFVNRDSVKDAMEMLTNHLTAMYESDQYHKDKEPMDTLRAKLGMAAPRKKKD